MAPAIAQIGPQKSIKAIVADVLAIAAGTLLTAGLWTPAGGALTAITGAWKLFASAGDPSANFLLATIGAALGFLGPGAWSVDARLFGWKRIHPGGRGG